MILGTGTVSVFGSRGDNGKGCEQCIWPWQYEGVRMTLDSHPKFQQLVVHTKESSDVGREKIGWSSTNKQDKGGTMIQYEKEDSEAQLTEMTYTGKSV